MNQCHFVHEGYSGYAAIYSVLVPEAAAILQVGLRGYNAGDVLPSQAFIGGRKNVQSHNKTWQAGKSVDDLGHGLSLFH